MLTEEPGLEQFSAFRETYVPWFPPCQPCGHCPACGRPSTPLMPPHFPQYPYRHPWELPMRTSEIYW